MAAMLFVTAGASAQSKWGIDASHSTVKFSVSHLVVSETEGNFKKFESNIETPGADFKLLSKKEKAIHMLWKATLRSGTLPKK